MPMQLQLIPAETRMEASAFGRRANLAEEAAAQTAAAVLSRHDEAGARSLASSRSEVYPRALGPEPLGKSRADTHVRRRDGPGGNSADVPRDAHQADGPRRRLESSNARFPVARNKVPLEMFDGMRSEPKFCVNCAISSASGLFRGRRLTVGCPVVVSPLPREWSCMYRRGQPPISFLMG